MDRLPPSPIQFELILILLKVQRKKKICSPFRPHKGKLPSFSGVDLTPLTDDSSLRTAERSQEVIRGHRDTTGLTMLSSSTSILKAQYGRPPGIKDVLYDERGNVVAVMKISPDKLPSHRVRTKFSVVDNDNDVQVVRTRSRPKKHGQTSRKRETTKDLNASKNASLKQNIDATSLTNASYQTEKAGYITPLPPPLVDTMDISAGVLVREGNIIRRGPRQIPRRAEKSPSSACLQPLDSTRPAGRVINDILTRSSPVIRPLHATEPIPPITSQPPTYS